MNVVIVGANKGLGYCLVKKFAENGHNVVAGIYGSETTENINELKSKYQNIQAIQIDVSDEESVKEAAGFLRKTGFILDALINCAGIMIPSDREKTLLEISIDDFRRTMEVNATGNVILAKYFLPLIKQDGTGRLFLITSEAGSMVNSGSNFPAYSVSKTAANKIAFILKATYGDKYYILAIHPGRMNTDMGKTTAQIEPEDSAEGIYALAVGDTVLKEGSTIYIDYKGEQMEV